MPGVEPHPALQEYFVINRTVARWFVVEVCHLLGFRRKLKEGAQLVVSRMREMPVRSL